jgi:leukotriene-A4 hydrolase
MSFSPHFASSSPPERDPATKSNYLSFLTTHISLNWRIDWFLKTISGIALLKLRCTSSTPCAEIILDSSYLDISTIEVDGETAEWKFGERVEGVGEGVYVQLGKARKEGEEVQLKIDYGTTGNCTAVGWLEPG